MRALILFAHGARDERWAQPFKSILERVSNAQPDVLVRLAFLELMTPSLSDAVDELVLSGANELVVVPIFLGQGAHVRRDLPALAAALQTRYPQVAIRCAATVGENPAVLDAIALSCVSAFG